MVVFPLFGRIDQYFTDRAAEREKLTPEEEEILRIEEQRFGDVAPSGGPRA